MAEVLTETLAELGALTGVPDYQPVRNDGGFVTVHGGWTWLQV
jgi:hypothetical protein